MSLRRILLSFSVAFSLLLIFGFMPAWDALRLQYQNWRDSIRLRAQREQSALIRAQNEKPPASLPKRPEDPVRYPRQSFIIQYVDDNGFGIDTGSGMVNYDRITDPDTLISLRLTGEQLDSLYEEALSDRLFEMDQPGFLGTMWAGAEHWGGVLTLKAGVTERSLRWDFWTPNAPWTDDHKRLNSFVGTLRRMVVTSPRYREMPRPRGGYID